MESQRNAEFRNNPENFHLCIYYCSVSRVKLNPQKELVKIELKMPARS